MRDCREHHEHHGKRGDRKRGGRKEGGAGWGSSCGRQPPLITSLSSAQYKAPRHQLATKAAPLFSFALLPCMAFITEAEALGGGWFFEQRELDGLHTRMGRTEAGILEMSYAVEDFRRLYVVRAERRLLEVREESKKYGVKFPGVVGLHTAAYRFAYTGDERMRTVMVESVRLVYLRAIKAISHTNTDNELERRVLAAHTAWPDVWPWWRRSVMNPNWQWTPEQHIYMFGPGFQATAIELLLCLRRVLGESAVALDVVVSETLTQLAFAQLVATV
jgi:hypothetical protein